MENFTVLSLPEEFSIQIGTEFILHLLLGIKRILISIRDILLEIKSTESHIVKGANSRRIGQDSKSNDRELMQIDILQVENDLRLSKNHQNKVAVRIEGSYFREYLRDFR